MEANQKMSTISDKKMASKMSIEIQVKDLEKTMVSILRAIKELKVSLKVLEEKTNQESQN
jgi:hypothetical protein